MATYTDIVQPLVTASLTAQNTFTSVVPITGAFNFSLSGTWAGTVFIQRSFDNGTTWLDVASYTANIEDTGYEPEAGAPLYRAGIKTGGYTSGTAVLRISK
jgi:hypothetical protein